MSNNKAQLTINNQIVEFDVQKPTMGRDVFDISTLGKSAGVYTLDQGFMSTASCESKITFIDGAEGVLLYRGYPVDQLAAHSSYLEVCYLLIHGELPSKEALATFEQSIKTHQNVDERIARVFDAFAHDAHPMAKMMAAVSALAGQYHDEIDIRNPEHRLNVITQLIAKIPTLAAMCYRHGKQLDFIQPKDDLDYAGNFYYMMKGETNEKLASALDTILLLHADHEQNASTSSVRLVGSTDTDPYAAFVAGIAALWGPSHGGANEAALDMLNDIGSVDRIPEFINRAKDKNDPFRLMGFGHRVYKNYDPRARVMQKICHDVLETVGVHDDPLFKVAVELEKIALEDEYFVQRKLYPNVDFYSGITQSAIGIPAKQFTVTFVLGRTVGWMAHWHEMLSNPYRIGRPRQLYTGPAQRDYPN